MEVKDVTASLKEWFFDLAGLFLPGATLIFLLALVYKNFPNASDVTQYYTQDVKVNIAYVITAYIVGYLVYGVSLGIDWIFDSANNGIWKQIPSKRYKKEQITSFSNEYALFKQLISKNAGSLYTNDLDVFLLADDFYELRNLAMSYSPESDSKIYNFTFRSEICNHLGTALIMTSFACLINSLRVSWVFILYSIILFAVAVVFKVVRIKYLDSSYTVPFSIANAKILLQKQ